jgi:hypothetical protein
MPPLVTFLSMSRFHIQEKWSPGEGSQSVTTIRYPDPDVGLELRIMTRKSHKIFCPKRRFYGASFKIDHAGKMSKGVDMTEKNVSKIFFIFMASVYIFYRFVNIKKGIIWIRTEMERIRHVKKSPEFQKI